MKAPSIVTFSNEKYIPVARNWLAAIKAAGVAAPVRIIALDDATRNAFPSDQVLYRPCDASEFADIMAFRITVLRELLAESSGLIHSDADAVWLRDPLPMINGCAGDMVFSQGTIWPPDVHSQTGIVLCCGLFFLRNTEAVRWFMARVEARVACDRSDQASVNRLLLEDGIEWSVDAPYAIPFGDTFFTASRQVIRSRSDQPLAVSVLPHHLFPRLMPAADPEVFVAHPLSPKTCEGSVSVLSQYGLWK